jgi:hypothetical protein
MNKEVEKKEKPIFFNDERKSGAATAVIIISTLLLLYFWPKIETTKETTQKQVEIAPPLDFKELDLKDLKVENKEGGQSTANNNPNRKTNSRNKLTSNHTGGDETPSGSERQSDNPFCNGGKGDNGDRFSRDGSGDPVDDPGKVPGGNAERKLINQPSIPKYDTDKDLKITLKVTLNDDGSCRTVTVIKRESNCNDYNIINDVIARVKRTIKYNMRTSGAKDHAKFTVRIDSR